MTDRGSKDWFRAPRLAYHLDYYLTEGIAGGLEDFSAAELLEQVQRAGIDTAVIGFSKDQWGRAFYASRMAPRHQGLGSRDILAEVTAEAARRGIRILSYVHAGLDRHIGDRYPEWVIKTEDGNPSAWGPFHPICPNSPYRQYLAGITREILAGYPVAGIFYDMAAFNSFPGNTERMSPEEVAEWRRRLWCYCDYCKRKFQAEHGAAIPTRVDWADRLFRAFVRWRYRSLESMLHELQVTIKQSRPEALFLHNYMARYLPEFPVWLWGQHGIDSIREVDVVASGELDKDKMAYSSGELTNYLRAAAGDKPVWVFLPMFYERWDYMSAQEPELELIVSDVVANGGSPFVIDNLFPRGKANPVGLDALGNVYRRLKAKQPFLEGVTPYPYAALFFSQNTFTYYGRSEPDRYLKCFRGYYRALADSHVPVQIITDPHLTRERLADYPVLVLPNAACLDDAQMEEVRAYVAAGGGLVCTGETSLWDAEGMPRGGFGMAELLGAKFEGFFETYKTHVALEGTSPLAAGRDLREALVTYTPQVRFLAQNESVTVHARVVYPWAYEESSFCPLRAPGEVSIYPSIVSRRFGEGTVFYLGCALDSDYYDHGHPAERSILTQAVLSAPGKPPVVRLDGPASLRMTVFQRPDGSTLIVHVVNFTASYLSPALAAHVSLDRIIPVSGAVLRIFGRRAVHVSSHAHGTDLPIRAGGEGQASVELPPVPVHEILTVELQQ